MMYPTKMQSEVSAYFSGISGMTEKPMSNRGGPFLWR